MAALDQDLQTTCEWCGRDMSLEAPDCITIHCNACDPRQYHEGCLEKMLVNIRFAKAAKTASKGVMGLRDRHAPCPRGKGPGSLSHACPGRVEKVLFARLANKKAAPAALPPAVEEQRPPGKQKKQKAPHVPPPTAPKPQKPKAPPMNYQRPQVVQRQPAFPAYVSSSVQALHAPAAPGAGPPPGAECLEDDAKANKAALKNLKRRAKQRQQKDGEGADGEGASGMGPSASGEWEGLQGFGGAASGDVYSVTDASDFGGVGSGEYDEDLALAMRLQQEEDEAAAAAFRLQQEQRPAAEAWPLSANPVQAQAPAAPTAAAAAAVQQPQPLVAQQQHQLPSAQQPVQMGAVVRCPSGGAQLEGAVWRCGPHPPRNAREMAFVEGEGAPNWPRSAHEWLWFLYGVIPAGTA